MNGKLGLAMVFVTATAAAALCMTAGCPRSGGSGASGEAAMVEPELAAQASPPIPDVPVPMGFSYVENRSSSSAVPGVRAVTHTYHGSKDKFAAARFFRKQMQMSGWQLATETDGWAVKTMDFTKENEACRITLQDGPIFVKTEVRVQIYPAARAGGATRK
jgi:hypothetical protein